MKCPNCGKPADPNLFAFEGVLLCVDCYKMVMVVMRRVKNQLAAVETLYRDKLRIMLLKGQLRPRSTDATQKDSPSSG